VLVVRGGSTVVRRDKGEEKDGRDLRFLSEAYVFA